MFAQSPGRHHRLTPASWGVAIVVLALCAAPAGAQDAIFCDVSPCATNSCFSLGINPKFEIGLRGLYGYINSIPFVGPSLISDIETLDLNGDGIPDIAHARLFDAIITNRQSPNYCCMYTPYLTNRVYSELLATGLVAVWPSTLYGFTLPPAPERDTLAWVFAGMTTSGQSDLINALLGILSFLIPEFPEFNMDLFDSSADPYLHANGDADTDGVCNKGEYDAWVVNAPDDYDLFVAAAKNATITQYLGGCPDCLDPEGEGGNEGEGVNDCVIDSPESYYRILLLFGDLDGNGMLSKMEVAEVTGVDSTYLDLGWGILDSNGDGELSQSEFLAVSFLFNLLPKLDSDGSNTISFEEVQELSGDITREQFDMFDINGNGVIDCDDLYGGGNPDNGIHSADYNQDGLIDVSELLRVIQFYNSKGYHCAETPSETEDGFQAGSGAKQNCRPHASDYNPQDWEIELSELLRLVQFYNMSGYHACNDPVNGEDGYCPGPPK